jgi:hypothetical protein
MSKDIFAPPTAEEVEQAKLFAPPTDQELGQLKKPSLSPGDKVAKYVEDKGGAILSHPNVAGALTWVGDKLERYLDAPARAQIGSLQAGKSLKESRDASWNQFGATTFPTTPSAKEIMARTGLSKTPLSEVAPSLFTESGEGLALKKGGFLDVSPAGVAGGLIQPSTWAIPGEAIASVGAKAGGAAAKVGGKALQKASPLIEAAQAGSQATRRGVFKVGEVMTAGNLKAGDAIAAADKLKGTELLLPEAYIGKAGKRVGAARDAIEAAGGSLVVPAESAERLARVREIILAGEKKAARTPGSQMLLERIDEALTDPNGIPVEAVDDMIRDLNTVEYTVQGNPRAIEPRWGKFLGEARGELEGILKTTPEGGALSAAKEPYHALSTAKGKRSKLFGGLSMLGGVGGATAGAAMSNPIIAAAAVLGSRAIAPRTYYQIVGFSKLPAQAVETLTAAYQTGKASKIGQAMTMLAEEYPAEIARLSQALTTETSRAVAEDGAMRRRAHPLAK